MEALGPQLNDLIPGAAADAAAGTRRAAQQATPRSREELERTARDFEAVFLNNLLKAMRATVPENELFNSGGATKFYQQMHDAEMAKALASHHSGMGIAALIVDQFAEAVDREGAPDEAADAAPTPLQPTRLGPPAPLAVERYRAVAGGVDVHGTAAATARLRSLAAQCSPAEADTLRRFGPELDHAARAADVDPRLVLAVVMEESGGDPEAESHKGALGLMQLMPGTARDLGVEDPRQPGANLRGGADYLARMLDRFDGRLDAALAAFNAGPANVERAGGRVPDFPETQRYVERVLQRYRNLGGGTDLDKGSP